MSFAYLRQAELPASLYEATVRRADYPALKGVAECDVCVVGGGFAGLHTALNLAEAGAHVILLEAKRIGWGASGRNGGHLIAEFASGMTALESALGEAGAVRAWQIARQAGRDLFARIERYGIDCEAQRGHLEVAIGPRHADHLAAWQDRARQRYGASLRLLSREELPAFINSPRYRAGLFDAEGGHLHPLKLCLGLARALQGAGGTVHEHTAVMNWQTQGAGVRIETAGGGKVSARQLVLCANIGIGEINTTFSQHLARRILPVGTWVIATAPLAASVAQTLIPSNAAVCDNRVVLDYFRFSADHRLVFGGGCSYLGAATPQGFAAGLLRGMAHVFPQLQNAQIDYAWGGVIDISMRRMPDLGRDKSGRVIYAQGFSGSGVVATNAVAGIVSRALQGESADFALFGRIRQRAFPGGAWLRGPMTAAGMMWQRLRDRF